MRCPCGSFTHAGSVRAEGTFSPEAVTMRKGVVSLLVLGLFLLFGTSPVTSQETSTITVKSSVLTNGVVVVNIVKAGKAYMLTCNKGASGCTSLPPGKYALFELPPNHGMYDCKNAQVYPENSTNPDTDQQLGNYCVVER